MSVETAIATRANAHSGLSALIARRCYPDKDRSTKHLTPYVIFKKVSTVPHHAMGGTVRREYRIQFDAFAATKLEAVAVLDQVIAAFNFYSDSTIAASLMEDSSGDDIEAPDTETQLARCSIDFKVFV